MAVHELAMPFRRWLEYWEESVRVLQLSVDGIRATARYVEVARVIHDIEETEEGRVGTQARLDAARREAELAEQEIRRDFPLLHAHTLVGLWGALEAAVEDVLITAIRTDSTVCDAPAMSRVKISAGDFYRLSDEERARLVVSELQRNIGADQRLGIGPFESLLAIIDLGGPVDAETRKALFELQQIRHVLVHRAGLADRTLLERCDWLGLTVGQRVLVGTAAFKRYSDALLDYGTTVVKRIPERSARRQRDEPASPSEFEGEVAPLPVRPDRSPDN